MKIVFVYGDRFNSKLTKFFTGSTCYHVGFTDGVKFWDMNKIRRRRLWAGLYPADRVILAECPITIPDLYLDFKLDTDSAIYGVFDYVMFALRGLYHLFGQSTRNYGGTICSEMIADDLNAHGWNQYFDEVPSPADLELLFLGCKDAINAPA